MFLSDGSWKDLIVNWQKILINFIFVYVCKYVQKVKEIDKKVDYQMQLLYYIGDFVV